MFVWKFSGPVDRDKHSDGVFRRTLKIGKNFTKKSWKTAKKLRKKTLENLEIGKKYLADTLKKVPPLKPHDALITWSFDFDFLLFDL